MISRRRALAITAAASLNGLGACAHAPALRASKTGTIPEWARLQRQLIATLSQACETFFARYFDERGYFLCFERWGANDGPDDAIENLNNWPLLHAIGGAARVRDLYSLAWEGHLQQYTRAKTTEVEVARAGMYYKDFSVQFDWQHLSEGLSVFNFLGLSDPGHRENLKRVQQFAGFYMGEDPAAPNWDAEHKIIRSLMTGSRGPMLRDATALDWAGDPFEVGRRVMVHGEADFAETLAHYRDYTAVIGDHPLNLLSTTLALNAFALTGQRKYRDWLIGYVDAWVERANQNDDLLPSNVGLDGVIGSSAGGKWWGGVYGWGFSPVDPTTGAPAHRNRVPRTITAFMNAYMLTGDDKYLQTWRRQTDRINAEQRRVNGAFETPTMFGDAGWYGWRAGLNQDNALEIWWCSLSESDRARAPDHPWLAFLENRNPDWPLKALQADAKEVDKRLALVRADTSNAEDRLADAVLNSNPAIVTSLLHQTMGAIHIARPAWAPTSPTVGGAPLYAMLRHFDPDERRAGLPKDVAALVTEIASTRVDITLVNLDPGRPRRVIVQAGGYGEHQIKTLRIDQDVHPVHAPCVEIHLAAGAVSEVRLTMARFVNAPTLAFPWDR